MGEAVLNGVKIYYAEAGAGVPTIALHGGLGFDHTYLKDALGICEDVSRLIFIDQRGNGRSGRPPLETITIPQLAEDVEALRAHLRLERIGVAGHSYGGFVALEYATRFPERTSHLIAIGTSPGLFEPTQAELRERADPSWITSDVAAALQRFGDGLPSTREEFVTYIRSVAPAYVKDFPTERLAELLNSMIIDAETAARSMQALEGWSVADRLGRITCPTLVLCGRYDLLTTPECSKRLSTAIRDARLVWFEHSGHFPWLEEPAAFADAIRRFLLDASVSSNASG